ncbi:MAG: XRE family transcriptional regulator [Comamonadaceae bacterium]|nr:MAG: XRE family transcriptional regulator [Comamonadaceae bacterium]
MPSKKIQTSSVAPRRAAPVPKRPVAEPPLVAADPDAPEAFASLGLRMRTLRRHGGMTVEALAARLGVNKAHVSRLERGLKKPSIAMLAKLAKALGTSMGHLVGETLDMADIKVTRGTELAPRVMAEEPARHQFAPLLHGHSVGSFEAFLVYPGPSGGMAHARHEGQEMLYVLAGRIDVSFLDRTERLAAGDCIHFPGYLDHRIAQVGRTPARALLVLSAS